MLRDRIGFSPTPRKAGARNRGLALKREHRLTRVVNDQRQTRVGGPTRALVLALLLLLAVTAGAQTAAQCREANDQAIAAFKSTLPEMSEHDRAGAESLIDELERLIKESRAQGVDECVIWQEINRRVSRS
jgi:hypothetical protein